jgi:hypothetical protein
MGSEVDRPDAVIDFFEADVMLLRCIGDEQQAVLEDERARLTMAPLFQRLRSH